MARRRNADPFVVSMARHILYLSFLGGLGGGESTLLADIAALDRAQFAPYVLCAQDGAFVDALRALAAPVQVTPFALPYFKYGFLPIVSLPFFFQLYAYARQQRVDLIHCNDLETVYYAGPVARGLGIPVVWTCHAWWSVERGWKMTFVEKFVARILTPTRDMAQCLADANPRLRERITILPFGVDTNEFAPLPRNETLRAEFGIAPDAPLVTLLARFQSVKGHATMLDAAPTILDAFPRARFLFVGDAEFHTADANATRELIYARINADERLRRAVALAGFRRDIARLLNASDVLVCPSDFESFGVANVEAMACGVPVVSTNVGGPAETLVDGETGFLIPPRDPAALAARVNQLLGDDALRARMGANGRTRVMEHFALDARVRQLYAVYVQVLAAA